jgi:hypothetical protein
MVSLFTKRLAVLSAQRTGPIPIYGRIASVDLASSAEVEAAAAEQKYHQHNNQNGFIRHIPTLGLTMVSRHGPFSPKNRIIAESLRSNIAVPFSAWLRPRDWRFTVAHKFCLGKKAQSAKTAPRQRNCHFNDAMMPAGSGPENRVTTLRKRPYLFWPCKRPPRKDSNPCIRGSIVTGLNAGFVR